MAVIHHHIPQRILMLTGIKNPPQKTIAAEAGNHQRYMGNALPQDKLTILKELPKRNHPVITVGDGVNDATFACCCCSTWYCHMGAHGAASRALAETADVVIF